MDSVLTAMVSSEMKNAFKPIKQKLHRQIVRAYVRNTIRVMFVTRFKNLHQSKRMIAIFHTVPSADQTNWSIIAVTYSKK